MNPIIVSDTGPLIALAKLDLLDLLPQLFSTVYVPDTVLKEATKQFQRVDAQRILDFVPQQLQCLDDLDNEFSQSLKIQLDDGEIQAISHAQALHCGVLIDEKRGRSVAIHHKIPVIGVVGVLIQAKQQKLIVDVKTPLLALQAAEYRISNNLYTKALMLSGET